MHRARHFHMVLEILARNVATKFQPDLVDCRQIAEELQLTVKETQQILQTMHEMGIIESDMESHYALITPQGMASLTH